MFVCMFSLNIFISLLQLYKHANIYVNNTSYGIRTEAKSLIKFFFPVCMFVCMSKCLKNICAFVDTKLFIFYYDGHALLV